MEIFGIHIPANLWIPILVSLVTIVIIGPLVGLFIKPYIEVKNNKILKIEESYIELITLIKIVIGNLNVVYEEASNNSKKVLIPTHKYVLLTRLSKVEDDIRSIIRLITLLETYSQKYKLKHNYIKELASVTGAALRVEENIRKNNQDTINGPYGLRRTNKTVLKKYIRNLENMLSMFEEVRHKTIQNNNENKSE